MGVLCFVLVLLFYTLCPSIFAIILMEKKCWLLFFYCLPNVLDSQFSVDLPHGAVGWSAECECGIS